MGNAFYVIDLCCCTTRIVKRIASIVQTSCTTNLEDASKVALQNWDEFRLVKVVDVWDRTIFMAK